jgi:hypothetical protein
VGSISMGFGFWVLGSGKRVLTGIEISNRYSLKGWGYKY